MTYRAALLFLPLALLAAPAMLAADEGPTPAAPGEHWIFDARVVKVVGEATLAEQPAPWAETEDGGCAVDAAWPELLQHLKARGATTILMDQRVTALPNAQVEASQFRQMQTEIFDRRDKSNEFWKSTVLNEGCTVKVLAGAYLQYEALAQWSLPRATETPPIQGTTRWSGQLPPFSGRTCVLSYREQVEAGGDQPVTVEVWVCLTARRFPRR